MKKILAIAITPLLLLSSTTVMSIEKNPADTNGDGIVDKSDAQLIYDYILGTASDIVTHSDVDVNLDGSVNTVDVVEVYHSIMRIGDVYVNDWTDGGTIDGGEVEEEINE